MTTPPENPPEPPRGGTPLDDAVARDPEDDTGVPDPADDTDGGDDPTTGTEEDPRYA